MKIKLINRTVEFSNRVNVDYSNPRYLLGASFRKADLKTLRGIKRFLLFCIMPYNFVEKYELRPNR